MRYSRAQSRGERGVVSVIVAVSFLALCIVAAQVIDLGVARDTRRTSQNAVDSASLAGANQLYPKSGTCTAPTTETTPPCFTNAIAAVKAYTNANLSTSATQWASCVDPDKDVGGYTVTGETPCITFYGQNAPYTASDSTTAPYKVRVRVPKKTFSTGLGKVAGVPSLSVTSHARATLKPGTGRSCGLCVIGTDLNDLGNGDVTVSGGSVHLNGSAGIGPNGHLTATPAGTAITTTGTCTSGCSPAAVHADLIADPLLNTLNLPPTHNYTSVKANPCTQGPGIYAAFGFPSGNCTLTAGLYVVTGNWQLGNNSLVNGNGVTLYFTCATTGGMPRVCGNGPTNPSPNAPIAEVGASFDAKNGDVATIATQGSNPAVGPGFVAPVAPTPPATTVSYGMPGYVMIYDRYNKAPLTLQGNGNTFYTGAVYAPRSLLTFPGTSYINVTNGPIIVGALYGNGNTGGINLTSVNGAFIPTPPDGVSLDQ
ncbi:MAG: Tad domain-containing protein [Nocardioidaceae bacterium]